MIAVGIFLPIIRSYPPRVARARVHSHLLVVFDIYSRDCCSCTDIQGTEMNEHVMNKFSPPLFFSPLCSASVSFAGR